MLPFSQVLSRSSIKIVSDISKAFPILLADDPLFCEHFTFNFLEVVHTSYIVFSEVPGYLKNHLCHWSLRSVRESVLHVPPVTDILWLDMPDNLLCYSATSLGLSPHEGPLCSLIVFL